MQINKRPCAKQNDELFLEKASREVEIKEKRPIYEAEQFVFILSPGLGSPIERNGPTLLAMVHADLFKWLSQGNCRPVAIA